jgi:DNA-binding CsgD family transcriptional regulator
MEAYALDIGGLELVVFRVQADEHHVGVGEPFPNSLTQAEREVAAMVLEGRSNREIAVARSRSERTVAKQIEQIFRKCTVGSRSEFAARYAVNAPVNPGAEIAPELSPAPALPADDAASSEPVQPGFEPQVSSMPKQVASQRTTRKQRVRKQ